MKVLITGAAGFLGSNLVQKFLDEKHQIIGLDNLSSGSLANLKEFEDNPNFVFVEGDVRKELDFDVDGILNFACPSSKPDEKTNKGANTQLSSLPCFC